MLSELFVYMGSQRLRSRNIDLMVDLPFVWPLSVPPISISHIIPPFFFALFTTRLLQSKAYTRPIHFSFAVSFISFTVILLSSRILNGTQNINKMF